MKANKFKPVRAKKYNARALSCILAAFLLVVLICSMVLPYGIMNSYAEETTPTVSITDVTPDETKDTRTVQFDIDNAETATTAYTIYYRTQNGSAVDGKNFDGVNDTITITSTTEVAKRQVTITISQNTATMDLYGITDYTNRNGDTVSSTKTFICEIYYAESTSNTTYSSTSTNTDGTVVIDSKKSQVMLKCHAPKITLSTSKASGETYDTPYYDETRWVTTTNNINWSDAMITDKKYHAGALANSTLTYTDNDTSTANTKSPYSYNAYTSFGYCYVPNNNYAYFKELGATRYIWLDTDGHTHNEEGDKTVRVAIYYSSGLKSNNKISVGSLITSGDTTRNALYTYGNTIGNAIFTTEVNGYKALALDYTSNYILVAFYMNGGFEYWGVVWNSFALSNNSRSKGTLNYTYYDDSYPTVTGYYVQPGTYGVGQTIRLSVKFSELVRVTSSEVTPYVSFNNDTLKFNYAGGDGTDTLYFEATVPNNKSISITDLKDFGSKITLGYFNYITDFTYNSNSNFKIVRGNEISTTTGVIEAMGLDDATIKNNSETALVINTGSVKLSIDTEKSYIANYGNTTSTYTSSVLTSTTYIYGISMTFTVSNARAGETFYYCWKKEGETAPVKISDYDQTVKIVTSNNTAQATISTVDSSGTVLDGFTSGKYTLYVLYRSGSFVTVSNSYNLYFDLDAPTITYDTPDDYNINSSSKTVTFSVSDTSRISSVEYAVSTSPTETVTSLANYFTYLTQNASNTSYKGTVKINEDTPNVTAGAADHYYVYVRVYDVNGKTNFVRSDFSVALDLRSGQEIKDLFKTSLYSTASDPTEDEFYDKSLGTSILSKYIDGVYYQSVGFTWYSVGVTWTYKVTYAYTSSDDTSYSDSVTYSVDGSNNVYEPYDYFTLTSYASTSGSGGMYYVFDFAYDGYYTIDLTYSPTEGDDVTYQTEFYIYGNEEGSGENYLELSDGTRYMITKYWELQENIYRRLEDGVVKKYNFIGATSSFTSAPTPVFATYQEAYDYVYNIELGDIEEVPITQEIINSNVHLGDSVTMKVGDTWYRYKPANWTSLSASDYVYYYYDEDTTNSNLALALKSNVEKIVGTLTSDSYQYATYNQTFTTDGGSNTSISTNKASLSSAMYASTVTYQGQIMFLASSYEITADVTGTDVYYCAYGKSSSGLTHYPIGSSLNTLGEGAYEFYEIGRYGAVKYYVYVDGTVPDLGLTVTKGDGTLTYWSYPGNTTDTIYGKSFTITGIYDTDEWTMIQVLRGNTTVLIQTIDEFEEVTFTTSGTYTIYVYDRSGNITSTKVVLESEEISVTLPDADDSAYNFKISNRSSDDLRELTVYYNNASVENDEGSAVFAYYPTSFVFYQSGLYKIVITDRYGYTYEQEIELYRSLPEVTILIEVNGTYVDISGYPDYYNYNETTHTYTILSPMAIYLRWSSSLSYTLEWLTEPDSDSYSYSTTGILTTYVRYSIDANTDGWVARIGYARDAVASIYIVADIDETPPIISVADENGESVTESSRVNSRYVTISWAEMDSAMTSVVYTFGDETYSVSVKSDQTGSYTLGSVTSPLAEGTYVVTATNIMGSSSSFTFEIHTSIDVYVTTSEGLVDYDKSTTVYQDEANLILFTEGFSITIDSTLYGNYSLMVVYDEEEGLGFIIYDPSEEYDESNMPDTFTISADNLAAIANGGTYVSTSGFMTIYRQYYGVYVGRTDDGELYLGVAAINSTGENVYDVTVSDDSVSITITFIICTEETGIVVRYSEDNEVVEFEDDGSFMYNKELYVAEADQNLDTITYISYTYEGGEEIVIYDGDTFTPVVFSDEGTYVIYITNKYTSVTTRTIRLYETIILDAYVIYADGTTLETSSTTIYSNGSVQFVGISRTTYEVVDIADLVFTLSEDGSSYILTISAAGSYSFTIRDKAENTKTYYVVISAPAEVTLTDKETALSGWDGDALRTDELYTYTQVSLKSSYISDKNIAYITYEFYEGQTSDAAELVLTSEGILLDKVTGSDIDLTSYAIGWLGDGLYILRMYDYSGNLVTYNSSECLSISYNGTSQLSLDRVTQSSEDEEVYSLELAASQGFYSNYELIFKVSTDTYVLTVNGDVVTAVDGVYTISPSSANSTYEEYVITYCDEFGNKLEFTAYIMTEQPQISYVDNDILVTVSGTTYAVGSPALTATGTGVSAYYYKDGSTTAVDYTAGEQISGDGEYSLYFVDIAGNISSVNFVIDTVVDLILGSGSYSGYDVIFSGAVATDTVRIIRSTEDISIVSVTLDGEDISSEYTGTSSSYYAFSDNGEYTVVVGDVVGNSQTLTFTIVIDPVQEFTYMLPSGYVLVTLAYTESGLNVYIKSGENIIDGGIYLNGDHTWVAVISNAATGEDYSFTIVTDNTAPEATFTGLSEAIKNAVTITAVNEDGTVMIYKDGSLQSTTSVSSGRTLNISCSDYGTYHVVFTDLAGNVTEYDFTILYTMSAFTIAFVVTVAVLLGALLVVIIVIRRRVKIR